MSHFYSSSKLVINMTLNFEHVYLRQKYNYLELVYEALEGNIEQASKVESTKIVKVYASPSCDGLPNGLVYLTIEKSATNPLLRMHVVALRVRKSGLT
jgi:hypothetical protein